jgi:hypothetical protein
MSGKLKAMKVKEQIVSSEFIESNTGEQVELKAVANINCKTGTYNISVNLTTKMMPPDKAIRAGVLKVAMDNIENVYQETIAIVSTIVKDEFQQEMDFEEEDEDVDFEEA